MFIQRILEDATGTIVTMPGGLVYHFKPEHPGGAHVCEVLDAEHIERFLSISEGYRQVVAVDGSKPPAPAPTPIPQSTQDLPDDPGDENADADAADGERDADSDDDGADADGEDATNGAGGEEMDADGAAALGWDAMSDDDVRALFAQVIGRKANARAGKDTMIAQIEAARSGN